MEVILKEDVEKLGHRGDVVKVADGYGRNYLLPSKLATYSMRSGVSVWMNASGGLKVGMAG